jgi:hypothetical protein
MTPTCGEVDGRTRCLALSVASAVSGTIAGLPSGFASTAASAEHGIQKTSEGRREWSYCGLSSILHVLGHATTDMRFRRDRQIAEITDSARPRTRDSDSTVSNSPVLSRPAAHGMSIVVPPAPRERSVPCRFAWPLPGGRAVIHFSCVQGERKGERRNASKTQARCTSGASEPPAHVHALPGTCPRTSRSLGGLSFTLATRGTGAPGAGSSAATRHPAAAAGGVQCHRTTPPAGPPGPGDRTASRGARVCRCVALRTYQRSCRRL